MSSYLFTSKVKNRKLLRNMHKNSDTDSNISLDSLEENFKRKASIKDEKQTVDTILVPFYEQDVLIKIPKEHNLNNLNRNPRKANHSYLMNKRTENIRKYSYLEMYRKKNNPTHASNQKVEQEIRSITPEFGDTERESISEDIMATGQEFLDTEAYNEMYYEKIIQREMLQNLERSYGNEIQLNENLENKSPSPAESYLHRSVSEITFPKRVSRSPSRRVTIEPLHNVKLGGLGPDMETIKPRLERARSLQRYSEKVRMENRLKIYKKAMEAEKQKQAERQSSAKRETTNKTQNADAQDKTSSYLIKHQKNKNILQKIKKNCGIKSADIKPKTATLDAGKNEKKVVSNNSRPKSINTERKERLATEKAMIARQKSGNKTKNMNTNARLKSDQDPPPVQISFMVNFSGLRPSSALKTLEAKHKMYQEKVKKYAKGNFQ